MAKMLFEENDGFDEEKCLNMYENSYDFYKLVLDSFHKDVVKTLDGMRKNFEAKDIENYRILVHGMKGAGGSAGAKRLVELATKSNALIKDGNWDEACTIHDDIINELERIKTLIPERIAAFDNQ